MKEKPNIYHTGNTPLHNAALEGDLSACLSEVRKRASSVLEVNDAGLTPLHMLAASPRFIPDDVRLQIANVFLNADAKVHVRDAEGSTPLITAAAEGLRLFCQLLVKGGSNINAKNNNGLSALFLAARKGHADVCTDLIAAGANIHDRDEHGATLGIKAAQSGKLKVVQALQASGAGVDFFLTDGSLWTPLHWAARRGSVDVCEALIDMGLGLESTTTKGRTPLAIAANHHRVEACEFLLNHGADPHVEVTGNHSNLLQDVIQSHEPRDSLDSDKVNLLSTIALLLKQGLDPNQIDNTKKTPLHHAAQKGMEDVCLMLMNHGANPSIKCSGVTVAGMASKSKHKNLAEQIRALHASQKAQAAMLGVLKSGLQP